MTKEKNMKSNPMISVKDCVFVKKVTGKTAKEYKQHNVVIISIRRDSMLQRKQ